ncbi:MAG TPA: NAD-dependent epimerase/dehydratase family protein [Candidatus Obscuribacterales bacterium]
MRGIKVLVTGCSGFLGGWLSEQLLERGAVVVGVDRQYPTGSHIHRHAENMRLITADLEDFEATADLIGANQIQFVYHLAAQSLVGEAARDPLGTFRSNIEGTWNILEACRRWREKWPQFKGIVVTSSDKAYGDGPALPYTEDMPMSGRFPYDVSKSCADLISRSYFYSFRLPVCVTRFGNLYGGGDLHWSRVVPGTIKHALFNEPPLIRSDGTPVRDYIYVKDAAAAALMIGERMLVDDSIYGESFNASNGKPIDVLSLVKLILKLCDKAALEPRILNTASLEIQKQYLSSEKIRNILGWKPAFELDTGLGETIGWYADYFRQAAHEKGE